MFSMHQLRNTFFALLHPSTTKMMLDDSMDKVAEIENAEREKMAEKVLIF